MSPYHFEIPSSYDVKASLQNFTLYLDIDSYNNIKGLFFQGPANSPWVPLFSHFCKVNENVELMSSLSNHRQDSYPGLLHLPFLLLRNAARKFLNIPSPRYQLLKFKSEDLICRCFGVYRPQILDILCKTPDLRSVTDQTRAAAGCMSCRKDIEKMIQEFQYTSKPRSLEIPPSMCTKIKKAVSLFIEHSFPDIHLRGMILKNRTLYLHLKEKNPQMILQTKRFIESNFNDRISLELSLQD